MSHAGHQAGGDDPAGVAVRQELAFRVVCRGLNVALADTAVVPAPFQVAPVNAEGASDAASPRRDRGSPWSGSPTRKRGLFLSLAYASGSHINWLTLDLGWEGFAFGREVRQHLADLHLVARLRAVRWQAQDTRVQTL